jgi:hypothetical protein
MSAKGIPLQGILRNPVYHEDRLPLDNVLGHIENRKDAYK